MEKDFRGRGLGNKILEKAENYARKHFAKELELEVDKENVFAYDWYSRHGFEKIENEEENSKRIWMRKKL